MLGWEVWFPFHDSDRAMAPVVAVTATGNGARSAVRSRLRYRRAAGGRLPVRGSAKDCP